MTQVQPQAQVVLTKNGGTPLNSQNGQPMSSLTFGGGWIAQDGRFRRGKVDLDVSIVVLDANNDVIATCHKGGKNPFGNGALLHGGDNRRGGGHGLNETVDMHLAYLPPSADKVVAVINNADGDDLTKVNNVHCDIVDNSSGQSVLWSQTFLPVNLNDRNANALLVVYRDNGAWMAREVKQAGTARDINGAMNLAIAAARSVQSAPR